MSYTAILKQTIGKHTFAPYCADCGGPCERTNATDLHAELATLEATATSLQLDIRQTDIRQTDSLRAREQYEDDLTGINDTIERIREQLGQPIEMPSWTRDGRPEW